MLKPKLKIVGSFLLGGLFAHFSHNLIFFYNTVPYAVPVQEKTELNPEQKDVIFMYQKNRTDEAFYKMLSYADNIVFVGDQKWKCVTSPCLQLQKEYNYKTLDIKLIDTLTQLLNQFPKAKTFAKLDDDALVHPQLYYDLTNKFAANNYAGLLREYVVDNVKFKFLFMEGQFYMVGRELAECFLNNSRVSENNIGEDIFLGKVVSVYCNAKYLDLTDTNMI
jgi:hypothetical protein